MLRVLIAGGGVAALEAVLALRALAEERVEIGLLAPEPEFVYRPMAVAEAFGRGRVERYALEEIATDQGITLQVGRLASVDPDRHVARTGERAELGYEILLVACGARPQEGLHGAMTFGRDGSGNLSRLLAEMETGDVKRLVFAVRGGASWSLPLYELALLTAAHLRDHGIADAELVLATHEEAPLGVFGAKASEAMRDLLESNGIAVVTGRHPVAVVGSVLVATPGGDIPADRVITLPRLTGPFVSGLPRSADGFIPTDAHGRVIGVSDVYGAGDATAFPVKQGGIATQQADAAAESIAARAGADITPAPFEPILRGLLFTGTTPSYLRAKLGGGHGDTSQVGEEALWWPPAKIAGRYLGPYLAARTGLEPPPPQAITSRQP
jgi:sulfide:quinone oxidoreductase